MRGLRGRTAGPAHDLEGCGCDEPPRVRYRRYREDVAGFREDKTPALQISARNPVCRRTAEDRHRQDRSAGVVEGLSRALKTFGVIPAQGPDDGRILPR